MNGTTSTPPEHGGSHTASSDQRAQYINPYVYGSNGVTSTYDDGRGGDIKGIMESPGRNSPRETPQQREWNRRHGALKGRSNSETNGVQTPSATGPSSSTATNETEDSQVRSSQRAHHRSNRSSPGSGATAFSSQSGQFEVSATGFHPANRIAPLVEPTVWHFFTPLAQQTNAVNLGQGFPGWSPPKFMRDAAARAVNEVGHTFLANQYARSAGDMNLVQQLSTRYSGVLGRSIDPLTEVVVTDGATGALFCCVEGFINRGDEVVVFEPAFDIYIAQIEMAGGVLKSIPLRYANNERGQLAFTFDEEEFRRVFTNRTRMLVMNTPHNPTGKVFTRSELEFISSVVKAHPKVIVLSDEVYEHMVYDDKQHVNIASLPGMFDRCMTISSAGKTFSVTGWKIGWIIAPAHLARAVAVTIQWQVFSVATPLQIAVAEALRVAQSPYEGFPSFYAWLRNFYMKKRDFMLKVLRDVGLRPIVPEGGFFIIADTSDVAFPVDPSLAHLPRDWQFCKWTTTDLGVAAIPPSSFYSAPNRYLAANTARFAFCKPDEVLAEAARRLSKVKQFVRTTAFNNNDERKLRG